MTIRKRSADLVVDAGAQLGEAPRWDARVDRLVWVDITGCAVHLYDPRTGTDDVHRVERMVGAALPRADGGYVLAAQGGFATWQPGAAPDFFATPEWDEPRRANDAACDPYGRLLAGTTPLHGGSDAGRLYRVDGDTTCSVIAEGLGLPNGIDWSPDGHTLYFTDSDRGRVDAYRYDPDMERLPAPESAVVPDKGIPDGHCVDSDGNLWVALWSASTVACYTPSGRLVAEVDVPVAAVTSCCFGGPDLSTLYITTMVYTEDGRPAEPHAGGLFACNPGTTGRLPHPFRG